MLVDKDIHVTIYTAISSQVCKYKLCHSNEIMLAKGIKQIVSAEFLATDIHMWTGGFDRPIQTAIRMDFSFSTKQKISEMRH